MKRLWGVMELTFRLQPDKYNKFFKMCVGLTNFHIGLMPLRRDDRNVHRNCERRLIDEALQAEKKRKSKIEHDRATKRARASLAAHTFGEEGELLDIGDPDKWSHSNHKQD